MFDKGQRKTRLLNLLTDVHPISSDRVNSLLLVFHPLGVSSNMWKRITHCELPPSSLTSPGLPFSCYNVALLPMIFEIDLSELLMLSCLKKKKREGCLVGSVRKACNSRFLGHEFEPHIGCRDY